MTFIYKVPILYVLLKKVKFKLNTLHFFILSGGSSGVVFIGFTAGKRKGWFLTTLLS
jgi:hypothetical protein